MTAQRLVLIRHANAEGFAGDDAKRRLSPRGEDDARAVGRWLTGAGLTSGMAFVSPATRAAQTWDLVLAELSGTPTTTLDARIYDNSVDDLFAVIHEAPSDADTLFLVGHNPSIAGLAFVLADGRGDAAAARELARAYPTSGIAVFALEGQWAAVVPGGATLQSFHAARGA